MATPQTGAHASGEFQVKITPQGPENKGKGSTLGRMSLEKQFHGDLEGISQGEMLTAMADLKGSGVYVAVERFEGALKGQRGAFALYHVGVMRRGVPELSVTVVPDSGSGELEGLSGELTIDIKDGKHFYTFEYSLPEALEQKKTPA